MVTENDSTLVVSESMEKVEQITKEAETEEKSNENAIIEEDDEEDPVEENDEEISDEEIFDEEEEEEEVEEDDEEEEENNNENQMEESLTEEKKEENNNYDNAIQEVAEEKKEEENNNDAIQEELAKEKKIYNATEELSNEKKEEEKKEEGITEPVSKNPVKKSRKRIRKKKNANKDKGKPESSVKTPPAKKAKTSAAAKDGEEEGPTSVTKDEKEGEKGKDKPETSGKKKASTKKVESMGMIFMCSSKTKKDCYQYNVFGLPAGKKETVQKIYKGMRLFLYDIDLKLMYGIYKASAPGGFNLEPKAFNSAYPSQVRFTVMEDCEPLGEEKFKTVIKENYYSKNKFNPQLNSDQVKNLCKLFAFANKSSTPKSKKPARSLKSAPAEPRQPSGRGGKIQRRVQDEPKRPPRSPRRPVRRNPERRPVDRRPVDRYPVDYRPDDRHADRHVVYEREAFVQPPPPVVPPLSYSSYETEAYRRDLPPLENRGRSYLDYEQTSRDRYYREREPISYAREYGYAPAPAAAEYNYLPAPALPPPRYSYPESATSDYRSTEGMRADYRIPAAAEGRYSEYRSSARDRVYRL